MMRTMVTGFTLFLLTTHHNAFAQRVGTESSLKQESFAATILRDHENQPRPLPSLMRSRGLIINFWSVNCLPCAVEMPILAEIQDANPPLGLVFVNTDRIADRSAYLALARAFMRKARVREQYRFEDPHRALETYFGIDPANVPQTVLIRNQDLSYVRFAGFDTKDPQARAKLRKAVADFLGEIK